MAVKKTRFSKKKAEIKERRMSVMRLKLRGIPNRVIASTIDPPVSERTVENDVAALRSEYGDVFRKRDADMLLAEAEFNLVEVNTKAWEAYHESPRGSGTRLKALSEVRAAQQDRMELLMRSGVIQEQPKHVQMEITALHSLAGFSDGEIDAFEDRLIISQLVQNDSNLPKGLVEPEVVDAEFTDASEPEPPEEVVEVEPSVPVVPRTPKRRRVASA